MKPPKQKFEQAIDEITEGYLKIVNAEIPIKPGNYINRRLDRILTDLAKIIREIRAESDKIK